MHRALQGAASRRQLVQMRSSTISLLRSLLRHAGYRLASGSAEGVPARLARLPLPAALAATVAPMARVIGQVSETLAEVDARLAAYAAQDPVVQRLRTVPGVGVVVGLTFRAFVNDVHRFARAGQVSAAIGLVPWEDSSAERRHRGHISKAGPADRGRGLSAPPQSDSVAVWRDQSVFDAAQLAAA